MLPIKANLTTSDSSEMYSDISKRDHTSWVVVQKWQIQVNHWIFWGGDITDSKLTTGYLLKGWWCSYHLAAILHCPVYSWSRICDIGRSCTRSSLAKSTQSRIDKKGSTCNDKWSTIAIAINSQFHGRVKHINIKYHFIWEQVSNDSIEILSNKQYGCWYAN